MVRHQIPATFLLSVWHPKNPKKKKRHHYNEMIIIFYIFLFLSIFLYFFKKKLEEKEQISGKHFSLSLSYINETI